MGRREFSTDAGRRRIAAITALVAGGLALAPYSRADGQTVLARALVEARRPCDGDSITTITVTSHQPSYDGRIAATERKAMNWLNLPATPTRPWVANAYMRLNAGTTCTEIDRSESERLLRAQPFIASATVRAIPDGPRRVRIQVDVVDELRLVVGASTRHGTISSLRLGSENLAGRGLSVAASARRGFAYRDGFGIDAMQYAAFGRPYYIALAAERRPVIGERLTVEFAEPFLTDLQNRAFHSRTALESGYNTLLRPDGANVSVFVRRTSYDVGWVTRIGRATGRRTVGLIGAVLLGEDIRTGDDLVIVADSGLAPEGSNPFMSQYPAFTTTRIAVIGGVRTLRFITVNGFDAVTAEQDMGVGMQFDALVGPSLQASGGASDVFVAADLYAGIGDTRSFFVARALGETRRRRPSGDWDGMVASARLAWYGKPTAERTEIASIELATLHDLAFPMQLTLRDVEGGLAGYGKSQVAGGKRIVARIEERRVISNIGGRADLAAGIFASAGKLWAGDVPYGQDTPIHASAGFSLIGAYPAGGKRSYRVDVSFPFNRAPGTPAIEIRFNSSDRTRLLWLEPNDVARARTGAVPVSLMKW
jgi:hypothetical protein